jgi:hypothetical protein
MTDDFTLRELGLIVDLATKQKEKWLKDKRIKARPSVRAMASVDCEYIIRKATAKIEEMMESDAKSAVEVVKDRQDTPLKIIEGGKDE